MKTRRLHTRLFLSLTLALFCLAQTPPAGAQATSTTTNLIVPLDLQVFIPCADGGAGEVADLSGNLHILLHTTITPNGRVTVKSHFQPQGVSGVGLSTGDRYQATGVTQDIQTFNDVQGFPLTFTFVNNFRIIGQGPGNNFLVHENFHVTVNANGEATAMVDNFSADCK